MNKSDLIRIVAARTKLSEADVKQVINGTITTMLETIARNEHVTLTGFGTFEPTETIQRQGRNPKTGEVLIIDSSKSIEFKPGKKLLEVLS
ncbi:histone family protein DNA-binding protein [Thalassoporum mexicanum PCC 7367]|uniref:HU family DNA-binding protein n=1 Tax=Thalassoporum mexicanum TaxID=3457544 RepID=UPI00029FCF94|nr:HU family DNA-binding protein [Pseudanabaena sp. PCC 7367]AFY68898.1 histone family protein DNA-binding protein [Pseudanabaena sp. PCC 7367]